MASEDYFCKYCALESEGFDDPYACQSYLEKKNFKEIFPELSQKDFHSKSEYICARHRSEIPVHHQTSMKRGSKPGNVNASSFKLNIANPKAREERKRFEEKKVQRHEYVSPRSGITKKSISPVMDKGVKHGAVPQDPGFHKHRRGSQCCSCSKYHHHTFESPEFYIPRDDSCSRLEATLSQNHREVDLANETFLNISNAFWYPSLCLNQFSSEFVYTNFESLWPMEDVLRDILRDSVQNTVLRAAIPQLTKVAIVCGPIDMLKSLISLSLVSK
jgi:hypothetical protein